MAFVRRLHGGGGMLTDNDDVSTLLADNASTAFLLTLIAGFSTAIGSGVSFLLPRHNLHILSMSLAFAGGVMIYLTLGEMNGETSHMFEDAGASEPVAGALAVCAFFVGVLLTAGFDSLLHLAFPTAEKAEAEHIKSLEEERAASGSSCHSAVSAVGSVDVALTESVTPSPPRRPPTSGDDDVSSTGVVEDLESRGRTLAGSPTLAPSAPPAVVTPKPDSKPSAETQRDLRMVGISNAVAMCLHNFPEGMAVFLGALTNPSMGVAIAFAIAAHNIPEGIVVSAPIFYATGSRVRAFLYSVLSGLAELLGAAIAYLCLLSAGTINGYALATAFGIVAGVMGYVSLAKLLPAALRFDATASKQWTSLMVFAGMAVMAVSLVLFDFY